MAIYVHVLFFTHSASGSFPKAQNVSWTSTNFKTLLTWGPTPSLDYSYTVEYSEIGHDRKRNPHCIRTTETVCDLSDSLTELRTTYVAEVLSEPRGYAEPDPDFREPPFTRSKRFCPYKDTDIGRPDFKIKESNADRRATLYVDDPPTAVLAGDRRLTIRDIFAAELHYKVTYRRASSTGKKEYVSKSSKIEITGLDRGESYCFNVQAFIPSREVGKQLGELSQTKCSQGEKSFTDVYSVGVIAGAIAIILAVLATVVGVAVACCNHRKNGQKDSKDAVSVV